MMALKAAVVCGIRVRLLIPQYSDQKLVNLASRTLEAGIQIYQYNKGILHAKVMIVDDHFSVVGAANSDMRSFRLNY